MPSGSRSLFLSLIVLLFSVLLPAYAYGDLAGDRSALIRLSSSILGNTLRWNQSESDPCTWEGVHCNNFPRRVVELRLPGDNLSGQIPSGSIGNLTQLQVLSLRQNSLSGQIPSDIGLCTQLRTITLQENQFSGQIPATLFNLTNLISLDISGNNLLGEIPSSFNNLIQLETMYLEDNNFNGVIPNLSSLSQLGNFNVSNNRLMGTIPLSLTGFPSDSFMGNSLCGSPLKACNTNSTTTDGDHGGGGMKKLSGGAIAGIVIGSVCGIIVVLSVLFIVWRKLSIESREKSSSPNLVPVVKHLGGTNSMISELEGNTVLVRVRSCIETGKGNTAGSDQSSIDDDDDDGLIFFEDTGDGIGAHEVKSFKLQQLLMAAAQVIEKGRFGTTYRAYVGVGLRGGGGDDERKEKKNVIVMRLKDDVGEREFRERVEAMGRLKHENLVPLLAYFYGKDERLLVYDDLGSRAASLASLLHDNDDDSLMSRSRSPSPTLTWEIRRRVILEIAKAIEYLHSSDPYFSHGNINSSSILLLLLLPVQTPPNKNNNNNNKFIMSSSSTNTSTSATVYLSEFGISSLISSTSSSSSNNGCYWAQEVVDSGRMTQKADVYSFGVLILELLTGKDPRPRGGGDLVRWVHDSSVVKGKYSSRSIHQVFDQELLVQQPSHEHGHGHGRHSLNNNNDSQRRIRHEQLQQMVQLLHLGISCTSTHPDKRPSIFQVKERIQHIIIISST